LAGTSQPRALVAIPTFNEAENIRAAINRILGLNDSAIEILIVDDNSPDGTGELVASWSEQEPRLHLLHRPSKMGLGTAYVVRTLTENNGKMIRGKI